MAEQIQISSRTRTILENFYNINPAIQFRKGTKLKTMAPNGAVIGEATIEEDIPQDFAIYDLSRLLSVLTLFDEPKIDIEPNCLFVKEKGQCLQYGFAKPEMIVSAPANDFEFPATFAKFTIDAAVLARATKALSILKLPQVLITAKKGKIFLQVIDTKDPSGDNYMAAVGKSDKDFKIVFDGTKMALLFPSAYDVTIGYGTIAKSPDEPVSLTHFKGSDISYHIAPEDESSYE